MAKIFNSLLLILSLTASLLRVTPVLASSVPNILLLPVPFTSQAPTGNWQDSREQDACEETTVLMAMKWAQGEKFINSKSTEKEILAITNFETKKYKNYHDTSASDTAKRLILAYFNYKNYKVSTDVSIAGMIAELEAGNIIIAPTNGRKLNNPNFSNLGPERHMVLIRGYDYNKKEFITNDPGTKRGEAYRYPEKNLFNAIRDYPTGNHVPIKISKKTMIIIYK